MAFNFEDPNEILHGIKSQGEYWKNVFWNKDNLIRPYPGNQDIIMIKPNSQLGKYLVKLIGQDGFEPENSPRPIVYFPVYFVNEAQLRAKDLATSGFSLEEDYIHKDDLQELVKTSIKKYLDKGMKICNGKNHLGIYFTRNIYSKEALRYSVNLNFCRH